MQDALIRIRVADRDIGIYASSLFYILKTIKIKEMQVTIISYG